MLKNFATPLKIAGAISCGVPVITTDIIEYRLWYSKGLYIYSSQDDLEKLIKYIDNINHIKNDLINYRTSLIHTFSWDNIVSKYDLLINSITIN
jgi:glycosyltransferase involved in cell wall biosynthesis